MAAPHTAPATGEDETGPAYSVLGTWAWNGGALTPGRDCVADEVAVALEYNGIAHAVMLASPACLDDFAIGFSITEGIVAAPGDILDLDVVPSDRGYTLKLRIAARCFHALKQRRRTLAGRTGCGICGAESLDQVYRPPGTVTARTRFPARLLERAFADLRAGQALMQRTGATHAAAWVDATGTIGPVREDVGRHNALDKLVGAMARAGTDTAGGALLVTSRASYEMVLKAAAANVAFLAAISAPTSLAVELADAAGVTLAGFVRDGRMLVYSHPEHLDPDGTRVDGR